MLPMIATKKQTYTDHLKRLIEFGQSLKPISYTMTQIMHKMKLSRELDYEFAPFGFEFGPEAAALFAGKVFQLHKGHPNFGPACAYAHPHQMIVFHPQNVDLEEDGSLKVTIYERQYTFDIKRKADGNSFVECVPNFPIHGSGGCAPGLIPKHVTRLMPDGLWRPINEECVSYPIFIKQIEPALARLKEMWLNSA